MARRTRRDIPRLREGRELIASVDLAVRVGLVAAVVLHRVWELTHSPQVSRRTHEGRTFVLMTTGSIKWDFPFLSPKTVGRALARLVDARLLVRARAKAGGKDAAAWWAVNLDAVRSEGTLFPLGAGAASPRRRAKGLDKRDTEETRGDLP
jgi:hypothetical protein